MENMLSPADVAVLSGNTGNRNNSGFGDGDGIWVLILLLALISGNGFGGFGGFGGGGAVPFYGQQYEASLQRGFDNQSVMNKLNGLENGICSLGFDLSNTINTGFSGVQQTLCQGFGGVNNAITTNGYETRGAITDLGYRLQDCCCKTQQAISDCCCQTQRSIDNVRFDLSNVACGITNTINNSTRDILESNNNNTRAILDFLTKDKIDTLTAENQSLRFQASQNAQNNFITANQTAQTAELIRRLGADCPVPAYVVPNPNCCYNYSVVPTNNGCGCSNF